MQPEGSAEIAKIQDDNEAVAIFNGWRSADFIKGPTQTSIVRHASGEHAAILPNIELATAMRQALRAHCDTQKLEAEVDEEIAVLRPRFVALREELESLKMVSELPEETTVAQSKRSDIRKLQEEQDRIYQRQAELRAQLREHYEEMRESQLELFNLLQACISQDSEKQEM